MLFAAVCPNDCSSHGVCRTVASIAAGGLNSRYLLSTGGYNYYDGSDSPFEYRLWDADKNQACVCDAGYFGADCSQRDCPRGADPLTPKCSGVNCVNEIQGFTLSSVGANAGKLYAIAFETPSGRTYTTSFFDPASASNVQDALQALPNSVTGDVSVNRGTDIAGNFRITVTFTSQTGNIPEFTVVKGPGAANVIAQPSEPVHTYSGVTFGSTDLATLYLFPEDQTGFRSTQFTGTSSVTAGTTTTSATTAIESAIAQTSALLNGFGTSVVVTGSGPYNVLMQFPSKRLGDVASQLKFGLTTFFGSNDQRDGNTESRICSDRGLCDYSNGVCACFPGYIGSACSQQSALAM